MKPRKSVLATAAGAVLLALSSIAGAQDFPNRPIKLIVPYPPGGVPDIIARAIAPGVQAILGQAFVLESRPGAGGLTGVLEVMRAPADGYTLLSGDSGTWAVLPALRPGSYDQEKSFSPVAGVSTNPMYISVRPDLGVNTIQEFIALVRAKPGQFNYASSGNGSLHHLFMESFKSAAGLNLTHVPYKGSSQQVQALLAGDIPIGVGGPAATAAHVKSGKLKWLMVTTKDRFKLTPEVASTADAGFADIHFGGDIAYFAPAATPRPIVNKISDAIGRTLQQPDVVQRVNAAYLEPAYRTPDQLAEVVKADLVRYARAVKISGAKVD